MTQRSPGKKTASLACTLLCILFFNMQVVHASTKTSASSGNWNNAATWSPSGIPVATDNVTIASGHTITVSSDQPVHALTVSSGGSLTWSTSNALSISGIFTVNGTVNMNGGNINLTLPGAQFTLGAGSSFTWFPGNNSQAGASLFINGSENFSSTSTLIIKKWYNYTVPIGSVVTGNFGNLTLNSPSVSNTIVEWNQNNFFQSHLVTGTLTIDQGWITLDKSGSISNTTIGNIVLSSINSSFYCHNGTHNAPFTFTTTSVVNNGGIFYGLNDGNGNVTVLVNGNFTNLGNVKITNNSGTAGTGNGNATFNVAGTYSQSAGDTRIVYNVTTLNSGTYNALFGNLTLTGGIFMGQTGCHTAGGLSTFTVTNNFAVNFTNASDKFRCTSLSSIGTSYNNVRLNLTVGGNLSVGGISTSEFTSAASLGAETIAINGNLLINGSATSFNYGISAASHAITLSVGGDVIISGGTSYLSRNGGSAGINVAGNVSLFSGTVSVKGDTGITVFNIGGVFNQSGGNFYLHNNTTVPTPAIITLNVNGDLIQSGGILNFDNNTSSQSATHVINAAGSNYSVSGNGFITHSGEGTCSVFGLLNFSRTGTINFSRTSATHIIQQVKQCVAQGCTVNISNGSIQVASHSTASTGYFRIATGGVLNTGNGQLVSNGMSANSGIQVDSGGIIEIYRTRGLYDGTSSAVINPNYNMNFYLHAYSIAEYNGVNNQVITGTGVGIATTTNHKYGILKINFNGDDDVEYVAPSGSNVFVRTRLDLVHGELNLNGYTLTIESGLSSAVTRTNGYIKSELDAANNTSIVLWKNIATGLHTFPFGVNSSSYIPVDITPTSGFSDVAISTRSTATADNQPYPYIAAPATPITLVENGTDISSSSVIDRWWSINAPGCTATVTLRYRGIENTLAPGFNTGNMGLLQWNGTGWNNSIGNGVGITSGIGTVTATAVDSFSHFLVLGKAIPLPIKLTSFNVKEENQRVYVTWSTATEVNNDHFNIERSQDAVHFESIEQIVGAGTSSTSHNYAVIDPQPLNGISYYRLKQTDYDGQIFYSTVQSVVIAKLRTENLTINDFGPNPFENNFKFNYHLNSKGTVRFRLTSSAGQAINEDAVDAESGSNQYEYTDHIGLKPGIYFLTVICNDQKITKKLIRK